MGLHSSPAPMSPERRRPLRSRSPFRMAGSRGLGDFVVFQNDTNSAVVFQVPGNLFTDPCNPALGLRNPPIGPTVDDLATSLGEIDGLIAGQPLDTTLDGYAGKSVDVTADPAVSCPELALWDFAGVRIPGPDDGASDQFTILDVDGTRLVIAARTKAGTSAEVQDEIRAIVESVRIEAPGSVPSSAP